MEMSNGFKYFGIGQSQCECDSKKIMTEKNLWKKRRLEKSVPHHLLAY
jgi:hypothetical protein